MRGEFLETGETGETGEVVNRCDNIQRTQAQGLTSANILLIVNDTQRARSNYF